MNKRRRYKAKARRRCAYYEQRMLSWLGDHVAWWMFGGMTEADGREYDDAMRRQRTHAE